MNMDSIGARGGLYNGYQVIFVVNVMTMFTRVSQDPTSRCELTLTIGRVMGTYVLQALTQNCLPCTCGIVFIVFFTNVR